MAKIINLNFEGYWIKREVVPSNAGIYLVYVGKYNEKTDKVSLRRLIYIGEAENVNERLSNHEKWSEWEKFLQTGEILIFSMARATSPDRERAECALIYHHKPPTNEECTKEFPYEDTTVISEGRCAFISPEFTVKRS